MSWFPRAQAPALSGRARARRPWLRIQEEPAPPGPGASEPAPHKKGVRSRFLERFPRPAASTSFLAAPELVGSGTVRLLPLPPAATPYRYSPPLPTAAAPCRFPLPLLPSDAPCRCPLALHPAAAPFLADPEHSGTGPAPAAGRRLRSSAEPAPPRPVGGRSQGLPEPGAKLNVAPAGGWRPFRSQLRKAPEPPAV